MRRVDLEALDKVALDLLKSAERLGSTDQFASAMLYSKAAVSREAIPHLIAALRRLDSWSRKGVAIRFLLRVAKPASWCRDLSDAGSYGNFWPVVASSEKVPIQLFSIT